MTHNTDSETQKRLQMTKEGLVLSAETIRLKVAAIEKFLQKNGYYGEKFEKTTTQKGYAGIVMDIRYPTFYISTNVKGFPQLIILPYEKNVDATLQKLFTKENNFKLILGDHAENAKTYFIDSSQLPSNDIDDGNEMGWGIDAAA